jgi:hypothetical protein
MDDEYRIIKKQAENKRICAGHGAVPWIILLLTKLRASYSITVDAQTTVFQNNLLNIKIICRDNAA